MSSTFSNMLSRARVFASNPRAEVHSLVARMRSSLLSTPGAADTERMRVMLGRMVLIRLAVLSTFLGSFAWRIFESGSSDSHLTKVCSIIGATFFVSAVNALCLKKSARVQVIGYLQFVVDIVLVTATVSLSGSVASLVLYLLLIVGGAVVFNRHGAVIIAALVGLSYGFIESGVINGTSSLSMRPDEIVLAYFTFIAIALVSATLADQAQRFGVLAATHARSLDDFHKRQQLLLDDISEGVISFDFHGHINGINNAARAALRMSRELDVTGMTIQNLFSAVGLHGGDELSSSKTPPEVATEIVLTRNGSDEEFRLEYLTRNLPGDTEPGRLLLLKDVSRQRDMEERLELHERMAQLLSRETLASQATASGMGEVPFPMIGESNVMKHIFTLVDRVARSDASVLITGESGTGKEIIARTIHDRGPRKGRPFVALNCGAIPENLIESELFGHKKGSFTGAVNDSPGLFRQAHTGTIFLDEVGELPLPMQTKLLRVLQERKVRSVGDVHDIAIDVRIVAATNRDLKKEIARGGFREDLYYRLNVVHIIVPPLRDRREDIPLFVRHFVNACCGHDGVLPRLSPEAVQMLMNYNFPGNIRELENIIERAIVLGGQAVLPEHLPEEVRRGSDSSSSLSVQGDTKIVVLPVDLDAELSRLERDLLFRALEQTGGVKKQAAELLGLNFRSFRYRLKKYGVADGGPDGEDEASK